MTERPIIFSGDMVRAILAGRKTQTRRVVKPQPREYVAKRLDITPPMRDADGDEWGQIETIWSPEAYSGGYGEPLREEWLPLRCPYGSPGDRLWVRETWRLWEGAAFDAFTGEPYDPDVIQGSLARFEDQEWVRSRPVEYRADGSSDNDWRPSIHMPRWASRLTLRVTTVRVERLCDLTPDDARAEGLDVVGESFGMPLYDCGALPVGGYGSTTDAVEAFRYLWDRINGQRHPWDTNPWVWAISFEQVES